MINISNKTTIFLCNLGAKTIESEESKLRELIDHKVAANNTQIMAYPYPKNYGVDRKVWTNVFVESSEGKLTVEYSVTFSHACLAWQHARICRLTSDEYLSLIQKLSEKYNAPKTAIFEPSEHVQLYNSMNTWDIN